MYLAGLPDHFVAILGIDLGLDTMWSHISDLAVLEYLYRSRIRVPKF